jgi:hypothetical protein
MVMVMLHVNDALIIQFSSAASNHSIIMHPPFTPILPLASDGMVQHVHYNHLNGEAILIDHNLPYCGGDVASQGCMELPM